MMTDAGREEFIVPGSPSSKGVSSETWVKNEPTEISDGEDLQNGMPYSQFYGQLEPNILLSVHGIGHSCRNDPLEPSSGQFCKQQSDEREALSISQDSSEVDEEFTTEAGGEIVGVLEERQNGLLHEMKKYFQHADGNSAHDHEVKNLEMTDSYDDQWTNGSVKHSSYSCRAGQRLSDAERQRRRRALETPEERSKRRMLDAERHRARRSHETLEETVRRLSSNADRQRLRRNKESLEQSRLRKATDAQRRRKQRSQETADESRSRRELEAERQRIRRSMLSPEEQAKKRALDAEQQRLRRSRLSTEELTVRRTLEAERRRKQRSLETHEETLRRRAMEAERQRIRRRELYMQDFARYQFLQARQQNLTCNDMGTTHMNLERGLTNRFMLPGCCQGGALIAGQQNVQFGSMTSQELGRHVILTETERHKLGVGVESVKEERRYDEQNGLPMQKALQLPEKHAQREAGGRQELVGEGNFESVVEVVEERVFFEEKKSKLSFVETFSERMASLDVTEEATNGPGVLTNIKVEAQDYEEKVATVENQLALVTPFVEESNASYVSNSLGAHRVTESSASHTGTSAISVTDCANLCEICGKQFRTVGLLTAHYRVHSNLRPHLCDICGRNFCHVSSLQRHSVTHNTDLIGTSCNVCQRTYCNRHKMPNFQSPVVPQTSLTVNY